MPCAIVTGSGGLIGSESGRHLVADGFDVVGIENGRMTRSEDESGRRDTATGQRPQARCAGAAVALPERASPDPSAPRVVQTCPSQRRR